MIKRYIIGVMMMVSAGMSGQIGLFQLDWAIDSTYVIGAYPSGEPKWILKSDATHADSIYISNDTIFLKNGSGFVVLDTIYGGGGGSDTTQYLNPYIIGPDTVGFYLTVAVDTVLFVNTTDTSAITGIDSTNIIGGWGIDATESPLNTWNLIVDSSQVATQYDLTLIGGGVDSTTVVNSYGTTITESPSNQWNIKVDSTKFATVYDLTQVSGSSSKVIDILGSNFTTSATSLQSTDLAYTFPTTGTYEIKLYGSYTCSNTANGLSIGWIDSGGLVASYITGKHSAFNNNSSSSSTEFRKPISAIGTTLITASVNASSTAYTLISETLITVSTTGTITYGFASGSGSYSATLQAGSSLIIEKLN